MKHFKACVCYDGTRYRGWQKQGNTSNTIQAKIESALTRICGEPVEVAGSGRTDAGVHAKGQVISFRTRADLQPEQLRSALREQLPQDIAVYDVALTSPRFHARLSATGKTYCYRIWNSELPCVFERNFAWQVGKPLDVDRMLSAVPFFLGTHDFAAFSTNRSKNKSSVRTVASLQIERSGQELIIHITGDGFLYNMVRIIVGTLVEIGLHEKTPEQIPEIFASGQRMNAGMTAPAQGLCLMEVFY